MRKLVDLEPELEQLIIQYKQCKNGSQALRFVLSNGFNIWWMLLEINTIIKGRKK